QVEMLGEGGIRPARRLGRRRALKREHRAVADLPGDHHAVRRVQLRLRHPQQLPVARRQLLGSGAVEDDASEPAGEAASSFAATTRNVTIETEWVADRFGYGADVDSC